MEFIKNLAAQSPMIIASVFFLIAALTKAGKEKGAILILLGAIGLTLMALVTPVVYSGIMPQVMKNLKPENIGRIYMVVGFATNMGWAGAIALIAIGTLMRPPAARPPQIAHR